MGEGKVTETCSTYFLKDVPAQSDAFGPHGKLANTISEMILGKESGRAIALLGSWGSGKSTVVRLIDQTIQQRSKHVKIVTFDAWEHERDSLRRSFIDNLTLSLEKTDWVPKDEWKDIRECISRRKRTQETTTTPKLTLMGTVFGFASLLLPVGVVMAGKIGTKGLPEWVWGIGIGITLLPISTIILFILVSLLWKRKKKAKHLSDLLALLVNHHETKVTSNTIETPEPTSIEFQTYFRGVVSNVLESDKARKLVLVIDNLDRVTTSEVLEIWSTMRTFFDGNWISPSVKDRLWLIVPFDIDKISRKSEDTLAQSESERIMSLVDRTFEARFQLPPPVLSKWYDFITKQLAEAMPQHDPNDFHTVYRIYLSYHKGKDITPRGIRVFINQLVTIHRMWNHTIPLSDHAVYAVAQLAGVTLTDILNASKDKTSSLVLKRVLEFASEKVFDNLVALHLNVSPEEAMQTILQSELEIAFANDDGDKVRQWSSAPGFWEACELVTHEILQRSRIDSGLLLNGARILDLLGIEHEAQSVTSTWRHIVTGALSIEKWEPVKTGLSVGLIALLKHTESDDDAVRLLIRVFADASTPTEWMSEAAKTMEYLDLMHKGNLVSTGIRHPFEPNAIFELYKTGDEVIRKVLRRVQPKYGADAFNEYYAMKAQSGLLSEDDADILGMVVGIHRVKVDCSSIVNRIQQRMQSVQTLNSDEFRGLLSTLFALRNIDGTSTAAQSLLNLVSNGYIHHYLGQIQGVNPPIEQALALLAILEYVPNNNLAPNQLVWNANNGVGYVNNVVSNPHGYQQVLKFLVQYAGKYSQSRLFLTGSTSTELRARFCSELLRQSIDSGQASTWIQVEDVLNNWFQISSGVSQEGLRTFMIHCIDQPGFILGLMSRDFTTETASLTEWALSVLDNSRLDFTDHVATKLKTLDSGMWGTALSENDVYLRLVKQLTERRVKLGLGTAVEDALRTQAFEGNANRNSRTLFDAMGPSSKARLLRDLRDHIIYIEKPVTSILGVYGDELIVRGQLGYKADDVVRTLFRNMLERKESDELQWMAHLLESDPSVITECPTDTLMGFVERVESLDAANPAMFRLITVVNQLNLLNAQASATDMRIDGASDS